MRHSRTHSFLRFSPMGKVTDVLASLIHYRGRKVKSIERRRKMEFLLLYEK